VAVGGKDRHGAVVSRCKPSLSLYSRRNAQNTTHTHRKRGKRRLGRIGLRRALCPAVAVDTHTEVVRRLLRGVCSILVLPHGVVAICGIQRLSPLLVRARKDLALLLQPQLAFALDAFACNKRRLRVSQSTRAWAARCSTNKVGLPRALTPLGEQGDERVVAAGAHIRVTHAASVCDPVPLRQRERLVVMRANALHLQKYSTHERCPDRYFTQRTVASVEKTSTAQLQNLPHYPGPPRAGRGCAALLLNPLRPSTPCRPCSRRRCAQASAR
jgi:hypothetical protein